MTVNRWQVFFSIDFLHKKGNVLGSLFPATSLIVTKSFRVDNYMKTLAGILLFDVWSSLKSLHVVMGSNFHRAL